jgi:hypothetical protein
MEFIARLRRWIETVRRTHPEMEHHSPFTPSDIQVVGSLDARTAQQFLPCMLGGLVHCPCETCHWCGRNNRMLN